MSIINTLGGGINRRAQGAQSACSRRIQTTLHVDGPVAIPHNGELVVTVQRANCADADFRIDPLAIVPGDDTYELRGDAAARVMGQRVDIWPLGYARAALYFFTRACDSCLLGVSAAEGRRDLW
jgi:hypothetical protein